MGAAVLRFRNPIFIAVLIVTNTLGNLFLAFGLNAAPEFRPEIFFSFAVAILKNPWFVAGMLLLSLWMIAQLSMFTWADLTYVLPMTASAYVFTALLGKFFLGEQISAARWAGIVLISFGVVLVSETPPWTHTSPPREEPGDEL